jgi:hypothetical protein
MPPVARTDDAAVLRKNARGALSRCLSLKAVLVMQTAEDWHRGDSITRCEPMICDLN